MIGAWQIYIRGKEIYNIGLFTSLSPPLHSKYLSQSSISLLLILCQAFLWSQLTKVCAPPHCLLILGVPETHLYQEVHLLFKQGIVPHYLLTLDQLVIHWFCFIYLACTFFFCIIMTVFSSHYKVEKRDWHLSN